MTKCKVEMTRASLNAPLCRCSLRVAFIRTVTSSIPRKSLLSAGRKGAAPTMDLMEKRKSSREYLNLAVVVTHIISIELESVVCDAEKWENNNMGESVQGRSASERGCLVWPSTSTCVGSFIADQQSDVLKPTCSSGCCTVVKPPGSVRSADTKLYLQKKSN